HRRRVQPAPPHPLLRSSESLFVLRTLASLAEATHGDIGRVSELAIGQLADFVARIDSPSRLTYLYACRRGRPALFWVGLHGSWRQIMTALAPGGRASVPLSRSARPKWHRLYYVLAAFDVMTVVLSLSLSHEIRGIFARSVAINQSWGQRLAEYSELGELAQAVDAPGNDVFDTLDVERESAKEQTALTIVN